MTDRNLDKYYRAGIFATREGMMLEIPPSGFDWGSTLPPVIDPFAERATQQFPLGTKLTFGTKVFRYSKAGTALTVSKLCQAVVPLAGHIDEDIDVPAIGDTGIAFTPNTLTTDDLVADELQDGFIYIYDGTGEGHMYMIKSHPAILGAASGELTLVDPIRIAPVAGSKATVLHNLYRGVIHTADTTVPTAQPVGWSQQDVTNGSFFWLLTKGPTAALIDGTVIMGQVVRPSEDDTGAVAAQDFDEVNDANAGTVGWVMEIGADATHGTIATFGAVWADLD